MPVAITFTWHNAGSHTIYARLRERLGREPTQAELICEVHRILNEEKTERRK